MVTTKSLDEVEVTSRKQLLAGFFIFYLVVVLLEKF